MFVINREIDDVKRIIEVDSIEGLMDLRYCCEYQSRIEKDGRLSYTKFNDIRRFNSLEAAISAAKEYKGSTIKIGL